MPRCNGLTRAGERCTAIVAAGSAYCYHHDPARAEERSRHAAKAARGPRATAEVREIKTRIKDLTERVLSGQINRGDAAVANQLMNTLLRALELEYKLGVAREFEERLAELERVAKEEHGSYIRRYPTR